MTQGPIHFIAQFSKQSFVYVGDIFQHIHRMYVVLVLIADDGESFEDDNPSLEPYSTRLIPRPASGPDQLTYTFGLFSSRNITSRGPHCTATSGDLSGCGEYPQLHPRTPGASIGLVTTPHCSSLCFVVVWCKPCPRRTVA